MSRNASGTYTLPSGNPVVAGTLIEATWANTTLSDLASAMTDSLSRSGQGGMTAALRLFDGTSSVPGLAWGSETTTGWYRAGAGDMRLVITGSQVIQYLSTGVAITGTLSASGNFAVNTNKFTVAASSGNTAVAGTLDVTGNATVGGTLAITGALTLTANPILSAGTANGVAYLNGSKVVTTGSALTFSGSNLGVGTSSASQRLHVYESTAATGAFIQVQEVGGQNAYFGVNTSGGSIQVSGANPLQFAINGSEQMRLTSTGLGIGTSSPGVKLDVIGTQNISGAASGSATGTLIVKGAQSNSGGLNMTQNSGTDTSSIFNYYSGPLLFGTANTERARIDSSGNFGVGATSMSLWGTANNPTIYIKGTNSGYAGRSGALVLASYDGLTNVAVANDSGSGALQFYIGTSEKARIDSSGNLGIGTTSPVKPLTIYSSSEHIALQNSTTGATSSDGSRLQLSGSDFLIVNREAASIQLYTNDTERARITSGGDFLVGTTTGTGARLRVHTSGTAASYMQNDNASPNGLQIYYSTAINSTGNEFLYFNDSGALRMTVRSNGGIANYQANDVNLSDRREKTNFAPAGEYLSKICAIPVQTFNYIDQNMEDDPGLTLGVVAQDVQAVAPELVSESNWGTEENPKMRLSIYQTDLQYALMKCIQEQQALIQTLTARIEALETKGA